MDYLRLIFHIFLVAVVAVWPSHAQKTAKAVEIVKIKGTIICKEEPDTMWPMHYAQLQVFDVRVDRVLKGTLPAKYLRVGFGHNPRNDPSAGLPEILRHGKISGEFLLASFEDLDGQVQISRKDRDWIQIGSDSTPDSNGETWFPMSITPKCVPTAAYREEAISLENRGLLKGFFIEKWKLTK